MIVLGKYDSIYKTSRSEADRPGSRIAGSSRKQPHVKCMQLQRAKVTPTNYQLPILEIGNGSALLMDCRGHYPAKIVFVSRSLTYRFYHIPGIYVAMMAKFSTSMIQK